MSGHKTHPALDALWEAKLFVSREADEIVAGLHTRLAKTVEPKITALIAQRDELLAAAQHFAEVAKDDLRHDPDCAECATGRALIAKAKGEA